ncbi:MAG: type II 3-dehydroquinate dehydratase [Spirochaetota bacterium]
MRLLVINGPNLNMLGSREPEIYGKNGLEQICTLVAEYASSKGADTEFFQSNAEGDLISKIHTGGMYDGIILNPAGYGHTSIALLDAIKSITTPVVEVHLSNIHTREEFRHQTYTSRGAIGIIAGFGGTSYLLAVDALIRHCGEGKK